MAKSKSEEPKADAAAEGGPPRELSLREIAEQSDATVVAVTRIIPQFKPTVEKPPGPKPEVLLKTEVIWGPLPKDPPPPPVKNAIVPRAQIIERGAPAKKQPSIGSMQPK